MLSTITLEPAGVAVLSLNDALRSKGIVPYATLSGHVEVRYNYFYDAICAVINNVDVEHSLIFTSALRPLSQLTHSGAATSLQTTEGLWWKEEPTVSAFVALSNITAQPIQATVLVSDEASKTLGTHTTTVSAHGTKIVQLNELQSAQSSVGGLRISYSGTPDDLIANGHLQDSSTGYSATIPIRPAPPASEKTELHSFSELGLMTGAADPMLLFPAGTEFTLFSVVRNISREPVKVRANFWWMQAGQPKSAQLDWISLSPYQSLNLNTHALLAKAGLGGFNGSVNLVLDLQGKPHSLLMASGSVDRSKTYVFQVIPRAVQESAARSLSYWSTGNGDDTMITIWNPADESQDYVFTLFFSHGHYDLPLHLEPRATRMFNVSEIIQNQIADKNGNLIPPSVHEGSARIAGTGGNSQEILVAVDSGTYNVRKATCSYYCIDCDGNVYSYLSLDPYGVAKGGQTQNLLMSRYYDGNTYNVNWGSTWTSGNTSVATVTTGLIIGVNVGSATMSAYVAADQGGYYCAYDPFCGNDEGQDSGSGTGAVGSLSCTSPVTRGAKTTCTASGASGSTFSNWTFTDGNGKTVTGSGTSSTWSGVMVIGGTVSVTVTSSGAASTPSAQITVNNRTNFAFTAVNPTQASGNSITCNDGTTTTLPSPPAANSAEGYSCADMAYSFNFSTVNDSGPNNGYEYVTSASNVNGSNPTQFQFIVVTDLLSATTFYNAQCGNYSSSNSSGFIAGSQLKQNVFDHEQGSVLSHWTEYTTAQNSSGNNIGTVLESTTAPPGSTGNTFAQTAGNAALSRIEQAVAVEPCGGLVDKDSSQACALCGAFNYSPYQSCSGQPVPYCH